jgi:hypothetical protein
MRQGILPIQIATAHKRRCGFGAIDARESMEDDVTFGRRGSRTFRAKTWFFAVDTQKSIGEEMVFCCRYSKIHRRRDGFLLSILKKPWAKRWFLTIDAQNAGDRARILTVESRKVTWRRYFFGYRWPKAMGAECVFCFRWPKI